MSLRANHTRSRRRSDVSLSRASLRQKKNFVCFSADFWGAQVDGLTDEWMSDFFVVLIKRIRNDERLIFDGVETFSFALKKDD